MLILAAGARVEAMVSMGKKGSANAPLSMHSDGTAGLGDFDFARLSQLLTSPFNRPLPQCRAKESSDVFY